MPLDKCNLIAAKVLSLIFLLFDVTSAQEVAFGIPQYVHWILHGITYQCPPYILFIFANSEKCLFGGCTWWLPSLQGCFSNRSSFVLVCNKLNIAHNKAWWIFHFSNKNWGALHFSCRMYGFTNQYNYLTN